MRIIQRSVCFIACLSGFIRCKMKVEIRTCRDCETEQIDILPDQTVRNQQLDDRNRRNSPIRKEGPFGPQIRSDPDRSFSEACIRNLLYGIGSAGEEGNYEKKEKIEISGNCGSTCFDRDTLYVLLSGRLPMVYRFTMGDDACGIEDRARRSLCGRGLRSDQKDHSSDSISAKSLDDDRS